MQKSNGFMCSICYSSLIPKWFKVIPNNEIGMHNFHYRKAICKCGNLAIIWDEDMTPHLYVDDIRTVRPCIVYHDNRFKEVRRFLKQPFTQAFYTDLSYVKNNPIQFITRKKKEKPPLKRELKYNMDIVQHFSRKHYETSDGYEKFKRTTKRNPKRL